MTHHAGNLVYLSPLNNFLAQATFRQTRFADR